MWASIASKLQLYFYYHFSLFILELGSGTGQTDEQADRQWPSVLNAPAPHRDGGITYIGPTILRSQMNLR